MNRSRRTGLVFALAILLATAFAVSEAPADPPSAEDRFLETLPLEEMDPRERERLLEKASRLFRVYRAAGDPTGGEVETYVEGVETLARFLKRETIEERRHILEQAAAAFALVDRTWLKRAFDRIQDADTPIPTQALTRLNEQIALLRQVADLLKEDQTIVAKQKALATGAERRFRDLLRLNEEGHRLFESIDHPGAQAALQWIPDGLDRTLDDTVHPTHERQERLIALYKKFATRAGQAEANRLAKAFRTYASMARAIERKAGATTTDTGTDSD